MCFLLFCEDGGSLDMWRDPQGSSILVSSSERDFTRDGFWECFYVLLLVSWGWVVSLIYMSRDPQGPSMFVISGEEDLRGFWAGGGIGLNASDGQYVAFGSVSDVFCLLREDGGFDGLHVNGPSWLLHPSVLRWEEFAGFLSGSRETGLELQHGFFLGAVLTSGCLLGVSVWIQCRWDGVQRCGGGTEETDYTRGTCSSCVGRRWKHCGDRACSGWSLSLTLI